MTESEKSALLYLLGNQYDMKTAHMLALCAAVGIKYPPHPIESQKGKPAPVTLATH